MAIKKKLIEELLEGEAASEVFSADGLFAQLKKALAERILNAEMDAHLKADGQAGEGNHRNGYSPKTVLTDGGPLELDIPYPSRCRAQGAAVFQLLVTLMGLGAGPAAIAAASDYLLQPAHELGPALGLVTPIWAIAGAVAALMGTSSYGATVRRAALEKS